MPNSLDFPLQFDARGLLDPSADFFAERFKVLSRGIAGIDEEIAVLLGDLSAADFEPTAAGIVNYLPGALAI